METCIVIIYCSLNRFLRFGLQRFLLVPMVLALPRSQWVQGLQADAGGEYFSANARPSRCSSHGLAAPSSAASSALAPRSGVEQLAEGRSHPFVCDEEGFTLLHYAARNNSRKLAKVRRAMWLRSALTGDESVHCCEGHLLHLATRLYNSTALSY